MHTGRQCHLDIKYGRGVSYQHSGRKCHLDIKYGRGECPTCTQVENVTWILNTVGDEYTTNFVCRNVSSTSYILTIQCIGFVFSKRSTV